MIFDPPFVKKTVAPGEPLTAQAWNDIVNALGQVHQHLENTEATALRVQVSAANIDLALARVTAVRDDGIAFDAAPPVPPSTQHVFSGLRAGTYQLRVQAPGYQVATTSITAPSAATTNVVLTASGGFMPAVFGLELGQALDTLGDAQISVARVLDVTGTDVPPANPGAQYGNLRVLMQLPLPGTPVATGQGVQLVIAATLTAQASVEVPSLAGLSLPEAQKALESLGLVLGKVTTKQTRVGVR
jgi:hypothetical protein